VKKGRVEAHHALRVSDIPRERIPPGATEFTLTYQLAEGQGAKSVEEHVQLERVPAGFGGTRLYFRCPGPECNRRVMVLYLAGERFLCRHCHHLAYASQCEDVRHRAGRRADKARARLDYPMWRPFAQTPMVRPKGMWRSKFWDLQGATLAADYDALKAFVTGLQNMAIRMGDRRGRRRRWRAGL
jgi:hypothetical protein